IACFILAFFFLIPLPPSPQITSIEFLEDQLPTNKIIHSNLKSQHSTEASGKHMPNQEIKASTPAPSISKPTSENKLNTAPLPVPTPPVQHPVNTTSNLAPPTPNAFIHKTATLTPAFHPVSTGIKQATEIMPLPKPGAPIQQAPSPIPWQLK